MESPNPYRLTDCPTCEGAGEIYFNHSYNNDPQQDDSAACPTCKGQGMMPEGTEAFDFEAAADDAAEAAMEALADYEADWR